MHSVLAFAPKSVLVLKKTRTTEALKVCNGPLMSASPAKMVSRRRLGQLALGTSAAILLGVAKSPSSVRANAAEARKKAPAFTKDDSGISYYDVKAGSGASPVDGDFVVVDYVRWQIH